MALNVQGDSDGALFWAAGIDLDNLSKDADRVVAEFDNLKARVARLTQTFVITPDMDTRPVLAEIGQLEIALASATQLNLDTAPLYQQLDAVRQKAAAANIIVPVSVDLPENPFAGVESDAKRYETTLSTLSAQFNDIALDYRALQEQRASGAVSETEYTESLARLTTVAQQQRTAFSELVTSQTQYDAVLGASSALLAQKQTELQNLAAAYARLSEAEKAAAAGTELAASINTVQNQINGLNTAVSETQATFTRLAEIKAQLATTPIDSRAFATLTTEAAQLQERLLQIGRGLKIEPVNTEAFEQLKARITALSDSLTLTPQVDTTEAFAEIGRIQGALKTAAEAGIDTTRITQQLEELKARLNIRPVEVPVSLVVKNEGVAGIDTAVKSYSASLSDLQGKLTQLSEAQSQLDQQERSAAITQQEHAEKSAALAAQYTATRESITALLTSEQQYTTALSAANNAISQKEAQLRTLEASYARLSAAEQAAASGQGIAQDIAATQTELTRLNAVVTEVQIGFVRLTELKALIGKTPVGTEAFTALEVELSRLQERFALLGKDVRIAPIDVSELEKLRLQLKGLADQITITPKMDTAPVLSEINRIGVELQKATDAGLNTGKLFQQLEELRRRIPGGGISIPITVDTSKAIESIETLRARLSVKNQALIETTDIETVARLNKEIEELQLRITRLGNVGKSGFSNELRTDLGLVEQLQKRTKDLQIRINTAGSLDEIAKLNAELQTVQAEAAKAANAGKKGFDDFGNAIKPDLGLLDELNAKLAALRSQAGAAKSPIDLAGVNAEIAATEARLKQLAQSGKAGFDEMGRPLREQEGLLQRLQREAAIYQRGIQTATLPENITKYNQKLEQTNVQIAQLSNAGKTGFDSLGNKIADTAKKTGLLQKGFSFLRDAAMFLPGIGIAGLIGIISDALIELISNLFKGEDAFEKFAARFKTLGAALDSGDYKNAVKNISELRVNIDLARQGLLSKEQVLKQYNETIGKTTGTVKSLDAAEQALAANAEAYVKMTLYKAAAQKALDEAANKALEIAKKRIEGEKDAASNPGVLNEAAFDATKLFAKDPFYKELARQQQQAVLEGNKEGLAIAEKQLNDYRAQVLDKLRFGKELSDQSGFEEIAKEFQKQAAQIAKDFKFSFDPTKGGATETAKALREINKLLEERRKLLEQIESLRRDGVQSGIFKELSELDKVNEKYDKIIRAAKAFNDEAAKAGRTNFAIDIAGIEKLRAVEVRNTTLRQDADEYLKTLDAQKAAFTQYAEAVKEIGTRESKAMFSEQTKGFDSYLDYLKGELNKDNLTAKIYLGIANIGEVLKFRGLVKEIGEETTAEGERQRQRTITAISSAQTLSAKLLKIETDYQKSKAAIEKSYTGSDKAQVLDNLEADKQKSIDAVKDEVFQKTELYKELSENVIRYTRDQLKAQIAATEAVLKNAKNLTPELRKTLENSLKGLKTDLNLGADESFIQNLEARKAKILETLQTEKLSTEEYKKQKEALAAINEELAKAGKANKAGLEKTVGITQDLAQGFASLADSIAPFNKELSDKFASIGDSLNLAADATKAFLTGNPADIIKLITNLAASFAKVKQSAIDARNAVAEFNQAQQSAQTDYNIEFRERMRQQAGLNKLKLDGLEAENKVLAQQRAANATEAANILKQLQQEQYISGQHTERTRGSIFGGLVGFFAGTRTNVANEMASLVGKSFEEIEKLYLSGRLEGKAKALYESLKKLKEEGANIDAELERVAQDQREAFTGTTAESITDTILQGFANGKKAVGDFADDMRTTIQKALLQAFRYQALEAPIKKLYEQLAADAQSGNVLDPTEIASFQAGFNKTIEDAIKVQAAIEAATGQQLANLNTSGANGNSLAGAIKGITENTAGIIEGRLGGMQMSLVEINQHSLASLRQHEMIQNNTAQTVAEVKKQTATLIDFFQNRGVKIA